MLFWSYVSLFFLMVYYAWINFFQWNNNILIILAVLSMGCSWYPTYLCHPTRDHKGTSGRSTGGFLWGASLSPLPHFPRWDVARLTCLKISGWRQSGEVLLVRTAATYRMPAAKTLIPLISHPQANWGKGKQSSDLWPPACREEVLSSKVGSAWLLAPFCNCDTTFPQNMLVCPGWVTACPIRHAWQKEQAGLTLMRQVTEPWITDSISIQPAMCLLLLAALCQRRAQVPNTAQPWGCQARGMCVPHTWDVSHTHHPHPCPLGSRPRDTSLCSPHRCPYIQGALKVSQQQQESWD